MQYFAQSQHRSCAVPILLRTVPPFSNVPIWGQNGTDFACCTAKTLRDFRPGLSQRKFVHKRSQELLIRYSYIKGFSAAKFYVQTAQIIFENTAIFQIRLIYLTGASTTLLLRGK